MDTYGNIVDFLVNEDLRIINITLRPCIIGEYLSLDGKCEICPYGSYLYETTTVPTNCSTCPNNALCFSGYHVAP